MLAFITNLTVSEIAIIVVGAILVFGKDLPSVVMRGLQYLAKLRKAVREMWNEAGLEQEMRRVRAELESEVPNITTPAKLLKEGRDFVEKPVQTWRKSLETEIADVVPVPKKRSSTPDDSAIPDTNSEEEPPKPSGDLPGRTHDELDSMTGEGGGISPDPTPETPS